MSSQSQKSIGDQEMALLRFISDAGRATVALQHAVSTFVDRTLGGSITPFVAYVAEREGLSDDEIGELESLLEKLQRERKKKA